MSRYALIFWFVVLINYNLPRESYGSNAGISCTNFRTNSQYGRHVSAVALPPDTVVSGTRSSAGCAAFCRLDSCQAYVFMTDSKRCLIYANTFQRTTDVQNNSRAIYMEKYPLASLQVYCRYSWNAVQLQLLSYCYNFKVVSPSLHNLQPRFELTSQK